MATNVTRPSSAVTIGTSVAAAALLVVMPVVAILTAIGHGACAGAAVDAVASQAAERGIPASYLKLYRNAGQRYGVPWPVLAAIGSIETDHGHSRAPGVRSGVNSLGCCAGPMQFNLRDGPPSTWDRYGVDGNRDGRRDIYDPADAIASAANYLRVLLRNASGNVSEALLGYNHSRAYVDDVLERAGGYARRTEGDPSALTEDPTLIATCASGNNVPAGPANLGVAQRMWSPRAFRRLPVWAMVPGRATQLVDARIHDDVVWILRRYRLRVTAAREAGHRTHGDGTALDLVPAAAETQAVWDGSAGRLARHLGWSPGCARSGSRPSCPLAPAIQFVGYEGYPGHGSPRICRGRCAAHLHISWVSPCYGTSGLSPPCEWVMSFTRPISARPGPGKHARTLGSGREGSTQSVPRSHGST